MRVLILVSDLDPLSGSLSGELKLKTSFFRARAQIELFRALYELELKKSSNELNYQAELESSSNFC